MDRRSEPGFPKKGWTLLSVTDMRGDDEDEDYQYPNCGYCDHPDIRYVHLLSHAEFSETIEVGCVCAEYLTDDYVNPKARERAAKSRAAKRMRFLNTKRWKVIAPYFKLLKYKKHRIAVTKWPTGEMRLIIDGKAGHKKWTDEREMMKAAFDYLVPNETPNK